MKYDEFIATVRRRAGGIPRERAEAVTVATLETLAERITAGEADDLAAQLPAPLKDALRPHRPEAERFGPDEFVSRVGARVGLPPSEAEPLVRAVMETVRDSVTGGEFEDVMAQLPDNFRELVEPAGRPATANR